MTKNNKFEKEYINKFKREQQKRDKEIDDLMKKTLDKPMFTEFKSAMDSAREEENAKVSYLMIKHRKLKKEQKT